MPICSLHTNIYLGEQHGITHDQFDQIPQCISSKVAMINEMENFTSGKKIISIYSHKIQQGLEKQLMNSKITNLQFFVLTFVYQLYKLANSCL